MSDLHEINRLLLKVNELEDSKFGRTPMEKVELSDRQLFYFKEIYNKIGQIIAIW